MAQPRPKDQRAPMQQQPPQQQPQQPQQRQQPTRGDAYEGGTRPVHEERMGRICAAVWEHSDGNGQVWHNVTFCRIYKTDGGQWARSDSFGRNDLPLLMKVANRVHDWLYRNHDDD